MTWGGQTHKMAATASESPQDALWVCGTWSDDQPLHLRPTPHEPSNINSLVFLPSQPHTGWR